MNQAGQVAGDFQAAVSDRRSDRYANDVPREGRAARVLGFMEEAGFYPEGATVLDVGCCPFILSFPLARAGADVKALYISGGVFDRLRETVEREDLHINPIRCS